VNVPKGYLIDYQNIDGGDSVKYTLGNNDRIKYFILSVYDQDGNTITDMSDYFMHIQFIIRNNDETKLILTKMLDYDKESYLLFSYIFDAINKIYSFLNKIGLEILKKFLK
jgi:hypothetical protein